MMKYLVLLPVLWQFLSACGSSEPTLNPTEGAQMLAGTYTTTITAEDLEAFETLDDLSGSLGEWVLVFSEAGEIFTSLNGQDIAQAGYTVKGDEIKIGVNSIIYDDTGCNNAIGRYVWLLEDDKLLLANIAGMCSAMDLVLTTHALTRQP